MVDVIKSLLLITGKVPWCLNRCVALNKFFFFSSRRRHTRFDCDWSSDVCSSDLDIGRKFRFLAVWVLAYVIVITLLPHKRDRYLLPVLPALALMVGWLWDAWAARVTPRALRIYGGIWGGPVLPFGLGVAAALPPSPPPPPLRSPT